MEIRISTGQVLTFCKKNWFKLSVVLLGLYVFFIKDVSFKMQVQMPENTGRQTVKKPAEKMADGTLAAAQTDKLELPFINGQLGLGTGTSEEFATIPEAVKRAYLKRFAKVALKEQEKYGIPASVILATAMHLSLAGKRDLTLGAMNHFALPCDGEWRGACHSAQGGSYRKYESAWASYRDFSEFAHHHFGNLRGSSHESWAMGMQRAGFGGDEGFAKSVIGIIEEFGLVEMDGQP